MISLNIGGFTIKIKNIAIMLGIMFVFLMVIGSTNAADANSTDLPVQSTPESIEISDAKSFSDLSHEIENAKDILVLKGEYRYDPDKDEDYEKGVTITKDIKIYGEDCTIDGSRQARCLKIDSGCKVTLNQITFKNGHTKNSPGGAIYLSPYSKLTINNCIFKGNIAYNSNGGAIAAGHHTNLKIYNSKFDSNKAISVSKSSKSKKGMGGALKVGIGSKLTLVNCEFKKNKAHLSIILVVSHNKKMGTKTSKVYVKNCLFKKNRAKINGVFYLDEYGRGKFINCIFKRNIAEKEGIVILDASKYVLVKKCYFYKNTGVYGGAIKLVKHKKSVAHAKISKCTFIKNRAKRDGGAIFSQNAKLTITKCKFIKNRASLSGGAVELRGGKPKLIKPYFKKNRAKYGGAILLKDKKSIKLYKAKFIKNKAKEGKNYLGICHHCLMNSTLKNNKLTLSKIIVKDKKSDENKKKQKNK